jgi:hypothetical protein
MREHTTHYDDCGCKSAELLKQIEALKTENTAQLSELHAISKALGTNEGHSSVNHIVALTSRLYECEEALKDTAWDYSAKAKACGVVKRVTHEKYSKLESIVREEFRKWNRREGTAECKNHELYQGTSQKTLRQS